MRPLRSARHVFTLALSLVAACQSGRGSGTSVATGGSAGAMAPSAGPAVQAQTMEQAGEYLTIVGSCNDCHTQGWVESGGRIPPADRFAGMNVGFRGSWGTSYGKNLRTVTQRVTEDRWVSTLKTSDGGDGKPPMPWWNTAQMNDRDLRAMYRYIRSLGPKPGGVPRALPAGKEPTGPWVWLNPAVKP
jgi:mono/diheme cytochrome c family protein